MKVTNTEYDGDEPEHPELIPQGEQDALDSMKRLTESEDLTSTDKSTFLLGWWAFFWLNPELHPDGSGWGICQLQCLMETRGSGGS